MYIHLFPVKALVYSKQNTVLLHFYAPNFKELLLGRLCMRPSVPAWVPPSLRFLMHSITSEPCMLGF